MGDGPNPTPPAPSAGGHAGRDGGEEGHPDCGLLDAVAEEYEADVIVVGRRGVSRLEAVVLGSVSNDTVREARRPVLVVPSPDD